MNNDDLRQLRELLEELQFTVADITCVDNTLRIVNSKIVEPTFYPEAK